ncbi:MAG: MBL fold metallo-hydrolase [Armatimonadota bacterium]|nr:MBL fold metallo-hydrolase [Armatimonadota bacterium]
MLVKVLRSGSGGNACYVELGGTRLLVDAGVPLEVVARELAPLHITPADLDAVLLTHEHDDHARGAGAVARLAAAPVLATAATLQAAARFLTGDLGEPIQAGGALRVGALTVEAFPVPHDAADPVGFRLTGPDGVVVIAVDLGAPTGALRERVADADVLVLEANYDLRLLGVSGYPLVPEEPHHRPHGTPLQRRRRPGGFLGAARPCRRAHPPERGEQPGPAGA